MNINLVARFNIEYNILYFEEKMPENFTIRELELFSNYFFKELLELWDWDTDQRLQVLRLDTLPEFQFLPKVLTDNK